MWGGEAPRAAEAHTPTPLPGCSLGVLKIAILLGEAHTSMPPSGRRTKACSSAAARGRWVAAGARPPCRQTNAPAWLLPGSLSQRRRSTCRWPPYSCFQKKYRSTAWAQPPRRRSTYSDAPAQPPFLSCEPALALYSVMLPYPKNKMYMKSTKKYHATENNLFWKCTRTLPNRAQACDISRGEPLSMAMHVRVAGPMLSACGCTGAGAGAAWWCAYIR